MTPASLIAWRARMGWTAKRAAEELGLSQNGYAAYERGWVLTDKGKQPRKPGLLVSLACKRLESISS